MSSLSKSDRLKTLLQNGYFPSELPPPFQTKDFAKYRKSIADNWPTNSEPNTLPAIINIPRLGFNRRRLSIVNPISQFFLSKLIADNWVEISKFIETSQASLDKPLLRGGIERAIPKPDFSRIELKKIETAGEFDHILYTDISRFYSTIYTHVIPWALYGKIWSKANMFTPIFKNSLGNQIDVKVRKGMGNQTIGIPIGPDTSRIISEIIAIAVERRYGDLAGNDFESVFRYVDDWFIGFNTSIQSEGAVSHLSRACTEYELELNIEKTSIVDSKKPSLALWPEELYKLSSISSSQSQQARDIKHYFETAFSLASEVRQDNVLDYALKVARRFNVLYSNYTLFESFILKAARASRITLPVVSQIFINYDRKGAPVNSGRISKLIHDVISQAAPHGHTSEVAWMLFLARELGVSVSATALDTLTQSENSVCILICLDLLQRQLIDGSLDTNHWRSLMTSNSLYDSNWLLAYEAELKGWIPSLTNPSHVDADPWFRVLKQRKISFYDESKTVPSFDDSRRLHLLRVSRRDTFARALFHIGGGLFGYGGGS